MKNYFKIIGCFVFLQGLVAGAFCANAEGPVLPTDLLVSNPQSQVLATDLPYKPVNLFSDEELLLDQPAYDADSNDGENSQTIDENSAGETSVSKNEKIDWSKIPYFPPRYFDVEPL